MGSDDYTAVRGGGALKLKGAKVQKKKKKNRDKADLEKNLATTSSGPAAKPEASSKDDEDRASDARADDGADDGPESIMTETERRHEEARKKRLLQLAGSSDSRPELFKTHKERVEKLNTYLSKLSEHHDMPKIGPG